MTNFKGSIYIKKGCIHLNLNHLSDFLSNNVTPESEAKEHSITLRLTLVQQANAQLVLDFQVKKQLS